MDFPGVLRDGTERNLTHVAKPGTGYKCEVITINIFCTVGYRSIERRTRLLLLLFSIDVIQRGSSHVFRCHELTTMLCVSLGLCVRVCDVCVCVYVSMGMCVCL